ncbi:MAG: phosphate ABC transporter permease subunit PstC [Opitutaceae bacterium]|nr:phosphate ABC transporter permease subunit PstC [Opitutaceae bacterium]
MTETSPPPSAPPPDFAIQKRRLRFLGLTLDDTIKAFFGGNAFVAVVVLALITIFLFREGFGFFAQNGSNLEIYRRAGLEYVDFIRRQTDDHTALTRYLSDIRLRQVAILTERERRPLDEANTILAPFDAFAEKFSATVDPLRGLLGELTEQATAIKTKFIVTQDRREERRQLLAEGLQSMADAVKIDTIDFAAELKPIVGALPAVKSTTRELARQLTALLDVAPVLPAAELHPRMDRLKQLTRDYLAGFPAIERDMEAWDHTRPVPAWHAFTSFVFGRQWLTASLWQDWYGILPLLVGSLMVSAVALAIAVPLGVGAAIYVNQIASAREQRIIKPCIEFISAFPSVVLGFFGIVVLGEALRTLSQQGWLSWVPGFPFSERLNILTAGCLLALIAVPTIFTLAEDALNNVPRAFKEASFALGASRLQTILRIIVPASLSGIISAVLLGLGRVIGETMVVLLCAGNRIAIPDFSGGLAVFTEPVHTMTGIIAQEMGEVVRGSIHYRALFVVGLVLFVLSLAINYAAQKIVRRYKISIG